MDQSGIVFNVQGYSIHDGPGIRTTVFLKGCALRCLWCHNPESQRTLPEVAFDAAKCLGCGRCVAACEYGAIEIRDGRSHTDRARCRGSGGCVRACPNDARSMLGRRTDARTIFAEVLADAPFYERSGGGVTLSGGEPLAQPEFAAQLLALCKEAGIHTVLDTCGYARWEVARSVLRFVDLVLFDFKHMDPIEHQRLTGVDNRQILDNARRIHHELGLPLHARVPVVPGHNDAEANIAATARFVAEELAPSVPVCLHPFHRYGESKLERLGRQAEILRVEPPGDEQMQQIKARYEAHGLTTVIGEYPFAVAPYNDDRKLHA